MKIRHWALAAAFAVPVSSMHAQGEDTLTLGGRRVVVWKPTGRATERHPVLIFSHGLGGCPTQSRFMTRGLAQRGYLVIAPVHRDAGCLRTKKAAPAQPLYPFSQPMHWTDETYADRAEDVRAVAGALPASRFGGVADMARLAVGGHSLGGYTALSVGGAWTLTRLPGVKAVLALAPYSMPFLVHGTMSDFALPVMFQAGTLDNAITTAMKKPDGAFDEAGGPKYYVEFGAARHSSWGNRPNAAQDAMLAYAAAFLDRYVRGESGGDVLERKLAGVVELRGPGAIAARFR